MTANQKAERWRELRGLLSEYRMMRREVVLMAVRTNPAGEYNQGRISRLCTDIAEMVDRLDGSAP
jgi:hypothetical protein